MADSKKHIRTCTFCKTQHKYCNCEEYKHLEPWHMAYCSENCKDIDGILSDWGAKLISSKEAYERLKDKDVSRKEFWNDSFRNAYETILVEAVHANNKSVPKAEEPAKVNPLEAIKAQEEKEAKPVVKKTTRTGVKSHKEIGKAD